MPSPQQTAEVNLLLTAVAVIWRCWFCTMNRKRSQAMAMMQKDDMKMGKFCAAFRNLHSNSANGREAKVKWMTVESRTREREREDITIIPW